MITYPLSLPAVKSFKGLNIRPLNVVGVTTAPYSRVSQVQDFGGDEWQAEFTLPLMTQEDADAWASFLNKLRGPFGTFLANSPKRYYARGAVRLAPLSLEVDGAGQTGQSLDVRSAEPDTPLLLRRGDNLQLGTGASTRLYSVLDDVDLVDGMASINIWPNLRQSPADGAPVIVENPLGIWRLVTTAPEFFQDEAGNMQIGGIAIREA
jgi:hypothetical protein